MKAFIGPLGDDIPSIIAILLALGLFFSGMTFALNSFNEKSNSVSLLKASVEMSRSATSRVLMPENIRDSSNPLAFNINQRIKYSALSYGVDFKEYQDVFYDNDDSCESGDYIVRHLVPVIGSSLEDIQLKTLNLCVRKRL